jgi:hypothetical protein
VGTIDKLAKKKNKKTPKGRAAYAPRAPFVTIDKTLGYVKKSKSHHAAFSMAQTQDGVSAVTNPRKVRDWDHYYNHKREERAAGIKGCRDLSKDIPACLGFLSSKEYKNAYSFWMTRKDAMPVFVLSSKQQVANIARFCNYKYEGAGVVGIDKTFNLGPFYVTTMVYQHPWLTKPRKNDAHPVFLAAAMLHKTSTTEIFAHFVREIQQQMLDLQKAASKKEKPKLALMLFSGDGEKQEEEEEEEEEATTGNLIVYGSDEEKAILAGLEAVNPGGVTMLCILHLIKSLRRYLTKHASRLQMNEKESQYLINKIFSENPKHKSLVNSSSGDQFMSRYHRLIEACENTPPWSDGNCMHQLHHIKLVCQEVCRKVWEPAHRFPDMPIPRWTNNLSEALNNT